MSASFVEWCVKCDTLKKDVRLERNSLWAVYHMLRKTMEKQQNEKCEMQDSGMKSQGLEMRF